MRRAILCDSRAIPPQINPYPPTSIIRFQPKPLLSRRYSEYRAVNGVTVGANGSLRVHDGGRLVAKSVSTSKSTAVATFDGGTLVATNATDTAATFFDGLSAISVGANGFTFDVATYTISLPATVNIPTGVTIAVTGTGALNVSGTTFDLTAAPTTPFDLVTTEGTAFSALPTVTVGGAALPKAWKVSKSADGKKITIKRRKGVMILAY